MSWGGRVFLACEAYRAEDAPGSRVGDRRRGAGHADRGFREVLGTDHEGRPRLVERDADRACADGLLAVAESRCDAVLVKFAADARSDLAG
jgi:hypothetical protein